MRLLRLFFVLGLFFSANDSFGQTTQLLDDFNRTNSTTVGNSWTEVETVSPGSVAVNTNVLVAGSSTAGREYVYQDVSAKYNTVYGTNTGILAWSFNFRQTRANPSGFDATNYGIGYVLGCNTNNFLTGTGYAVVFGNSSTPDNVRLVKFTGGLAANINLATVIGPVSGSFFTTEYITVQVQYNPVSNSWSLYVASSTTAFIDPAVATFTQVGSTVTDNSYTGLDLLYTGCFWNHATGSTDFGYFDNIRIPTACIINSEPTIPSSGLTATAIGANAMTLNWSRGDGTECIIIAHQSGAVVTTPTDGITYTPNSIFGQGTQTATNEFVVYSGSGTSVTITGLSPNLNYQFKIFEFNGAGCTSNFLPGSPATGSFTTIGCVLAVEPTLNSSSISITSTMPNSMSLSWIRGNGAYCIVVIRAGGPVSTPPIDGTAYTANSIYGLGSTTAIGDFVVYIGTGSSVIVNGLLPGSIYYFSVFEMNGTGCNSNFLVPGTWTSTNGVTPTVPTYNYYYGTLHSHSDYSDGDMDNVCNGAGSPTCCYTIGDNAINFDFQGIADHNHNEGPVMTPAKYASGLSEATTYSNANFVSLYGMEWGTISTGGHATVYGINQLLGWNTGNYDVYVAKGDYNTLFNMVAATANGFSTLCHPNTNDYGNLANVGYNATYDNAIVGVAVRNGPYNSTNTTYSDPSTSSYVPYWHNLLAKGYHLGPLIDMDNHNSNTMGKSSEARTAILAPSLSRANVIDAYMNMRFYATDDYNLRVDYKINGVFPMGSIVAQNTNPTLTVSASDLDGEAITMIKIYYGVPGSGSSPIVLTSSASSSITFTHSFSSGTFYYYAEITEADGDLAWTSPIWYTKTTVPLPIELISFIGASIPTGNKLKWVTASEINNSYFTIERSVDGENFKAIGEVAGSGNSTMPVSYSYLDVSPLNGINYYRLKQTDFDNKFSYTHTIALSRVRYNDLFTVWPNPTTGQLNVHVADAFSGTMELKIFDMIGREIYAQKNIIEKDLSVEPFFKTPGVYSVMMLLDGEPVVKKIIVE